MNLGANDYLTKPCSTKDLLDAIASRLKQQQAYTQEQKPVLEPQSDMRDPLTQLPTRSRLRQQLQAWQQEAPGSGMAVFCLSIHRFRTINATFGHGTGDVLLQMVTHRLKRVVGTQGLVVRLNGDEFGIALHQADTVALTALAKQITLALQVPYGIGGQEIRIQTSLGIATSQSAQLQPEPLLTQAETAQAWCKRKGNCQFCFYRPTMDQMDVERRLIEMDLSRAIERSEFQVYYQPQVDSTSGDILGFEALVRWQHPRHGLVSPAAFIPLAEELGLIVPLGEWVLRTACQQVKRWQQPGAQPLRVSVNLSIRQLQQSDLVDRVATILAETGLDPSLLVLELTESMMMQDMQQATQTLRSLQALGVEIALDDFGTGYSSLNYLNHLPIDCLKLDRAFVKGVETDPNTAKISAAIIQMAQSLNLGLVAEGVETATELAFLRDRGCQTIQGFFYCPAVPAAQIQTLLQRGRLVGAAH
jgi:diguanylate cyclase (GGDEF)-like protein